MLLKILVFTACFLSQFIYAVAMNKLSPELKNELSSPKIQKGIENFMSNNSENAIENLSTNIPISKEQNRDSEKFKNEYNGKDIKQLEKKSNEKMESLENMKFLKKANEASVSVDRNDPVFAKYNAALKNNSASKDCMEILGTVGSEVEGGKDLPEFLEVEKTRQIPRTTFDVKSCEDMKNKYSCNLILKPKCLKQDSRGLKLVNVVSNDGTSIYHYSNKILISNVRNYSSYEVYFDIEDGIEIDEFTFTMIRSNNALEIHFNGRQIYDGPNGLTYVGSGYFGSAHDSWVDANVKHDVRKKSNRLYFKATKFGKFWVELSLVAKVKICKEWKDSWEEGCVQQK